MANEDVTDRLTSLEVIRRFRAHDYTLDDFVASRRERHPGREMMVFEGRAWSWQQVEETVQRMAFQLRADGVQAGDRIVVMGRNSPWHLLLLLAAARVGSIFVPINPQFKLEEVAYVVGHCRPAMLLTDVEAMPVAREALSQAGVSAVLHEMGEGWARAGQALPASRGDAEATCIIIYTSGTTGFPKGVMHSQQSLICAGEAFVERLHLQPEDRLLLILPMFHINAMFYSVAGALAAGATLLVEQRFSASTFWQRVQALRATQVNIIEAVAAILLNRPASEFIPGHTLRKIYGLRQAMMAPFRERFGVPVLVGGYAMTEIPGVLSTPVQGEVPPNCMGLLCRHPHPGRPWAECRIVDDDGRDVTVGETGELAVRTPILMQGYFNDEEQTRKSFRDGWFLTGDLVRADAQGRYYFVSRKKDIIRRRGENVAGSELDRVIGEHPGVLVAAAIGVHSEFGDEDILVAVKPKEGLALTEQDVVDWCRQRLTAMKVPRYVILLDDMPLTPTHKVAKAELRKDPTLRQRAVDFNA